jgi:predicted metal-dependent enzyme (double-stranded beta helix superfamily)
VLGRDVIHAVVNPLDHATGAIHVYGGDFFGTPGSEFDRKTFEERPYDVERAKRVFLEANERRRCS